MIEQQELIPYLYRTEYRKIVSVLCRHFGFDQIETAEDIAGDTFLAASETWALKGVPPNPAAWLYHVAKNKARNYLYRHALFENKIFPGLQSTAPGSYQEEIDLSPQNINDSQLQMMFAVCHPAISQEAQIGLSLRILCGFGIEEIAAAFLTNKETINKRLYRAKEKLRQEKIKIELPGPAEIDRRLEAAIAYWHTQKSDTQEKWENILQLYNQLLQIEYSPVAALNRTYALSKANGKEEAIVEAEKLNLAGNHFYYTLLGELYTGLNNRKAKQYFQKARSLAKTRADRQAIQKKIDRL